MDIAELDRESAELLPDRQALGCWNYGWHSCHGWQGWHGWNGCGHEEVTVQVTVSVTGQW